MEGFDFRIDGTGELLIDAESGDLKQVTDDDLRVQMAYTRIKSVTRNWFYDEVGANLEELLGRPMQTEIAEVGKNRIIQALTFDDLWSDEDIYIQTIIEDYKHLIYAVYLKIYTDDEFGEGSKNIKVDLDLVKGVRVRYGWDSNNNYIVK